MIIWNCFGNHVTVAKRSKSYATDRGYIIFAMVFCRINN